MKKALLKKLLLSGEIIFGLILVLVIVVSVFPLIPPFKNYYHSRTVLTGSMEPKIHKGSVVINQWVDQKNLKVGDVITYQHPVDKNIIYITHRIVKIDKNGLLWRFETKGDANPVSDFGSITQAGTEGKVVLTIPFIGYLIEFFKNPVGFILLVAIPLLIFIVTQTRDVLRLWQKRNSPKNNSKILGVLFIILAFLTTRFSLVTYASFTSGQATITGVTLSTAASFGSVPQSGDVVINEVYYQGGANSEWVELYNAGNTDVDLNGWKIGDSFSDDPLATSSLILSPNSFAVIVGSNNSGLAIAPGAIKIILPSTAVGNNLNNDGDRIYIEDNNHNIVDELSYGNNTSVWNPAIPLVTTGHSFARSPKGFDTNQVANFVDLAVPNPGTNPHPPTPTIPSLTPTPTLEPTITATPTPTQSPSPEVSPTPTLTPSPTPEISPTPTPTVEPSPTPVPSTTPSPSPSQPTTSPTPTSEPTPTDTPAPSPEPSPTPTVLPESSPSPTPNP